MLAALAAAAAAWLAWAAVPRESGGSARPLQRDALLLAIVGLSLSWWAAACAALVLRVAVPSWERRIAGRELPLDVADVLPLTVALAVCHSAGATGTDAWRQAASVVGTRPARVCESVIRAVELGARYPAALDAISVQQPRLAALCHVLSRAYVTGAVATPALMDLIRQLGADAHSDRLQRVRRLGVRAAIPLGLCFLPAFILLGVVPIAAGFL